MVILLVAGGAFIALAATAMLTDHEVLAGAFGLLALLGFSLAALAPRMQGEVKAGLNGFSFELIREVVDAGDHGDSPDDVILTAVRKAIRDQNPSTEPDLEEESDDYRDGPGKAATTDQLAEALLARARRRLAAADRS
ncbi:hypothetical protein GCM10009789_35150 [Kribbella sancticallisti]|uniref:Superfamily III holin-X n=1 Tax=Kribbella sancticallisti TaxID=460087 RepID=A0ABN2DMW3_9ACTN